MNKTFLQKDKRRTDYLSKCPLWVNGRNYNVILTTGGFRE